MILAISPGFLSVSGIGAQSPRPRKDPSIQRPNQSGNLDGRASQRNFADGKSRLHNTDRQFRPTLGVRAQSLEATVPTANVQVSHSTARSRLE
jgi:hypothetical protein